MEYELTSELLGAAAGAVVSWIFSYTPKLNEWYKKNTPGQKGLIMFLVMALVSLAVYGLSCANSPFNFGVTCDQDGAWKLGAILFFAVVGNQATYLLSPKKGGAGS